MINWIEGNQNIGFPNSWLCIKLDAHRYYKRISGLNIKCVDYMILDPNWGLFLIEIKDYPSAATIPSQKAHQATLLAKKQGSIRLIQTVNAALRRQWYYRIIFLKLKIYRFCPKEWQIWHLAEAYIQENRLLVIGDFQLQDLAHRLNYDY